jgi:small subunit ribosomal protein S6
VRLYETVYILNPTLEDEQQQTLVDRFSTLVQNHGGEIEHLERWDRRRLAYEIQGQREGDYIVMNFRGTPATETELDRVFRITDGILRHIIVRMDERLAARKLAEAKAMLEARERARAEAEARAAEAAAAQAAQEAQAAQAAQEAHAAQEAQAARDAEAARSAQEAASAEAATSGEAEASGEAAASGEEESTPPQAEGEGNQAEASAAEATDEREG